MPAAPASSAVICPDRVTVSTAVAQRKQRIVLTVGGRRDVDVLDEAEEVELVDEDGDDIFAVVLKVRRSGVCMVG